MAYPENKPEGIYNLIDYDFGVNDPNLIPLDENSFKKGFRNKNESQLDSVPDAHQANWLYSYFNQHVRYAEQTAEENKYLLANKIATPTTIGQIKVGYGLDISTSGVLSVSKGVAEDANIISYDLPVGSYMLWSGNNPPEYFIEPAGQTLLRSNYPELWEFAQSNNLVGTLFGNGDGSTTFTVTDIRGNFISIANSNDKVGKFTEAGLPDHNHRLLPDNRGKWYGGAGGGTGLIWYGSGYPGDTLNASDSNPIYGNSETVTPANWALKLILKAKPTPPNKTVPVGSIMDYTGTVAPDGFIIANGAELSRTTFADLFNWAVANNLLKEQSTIPTTAHAYYGTGDGSTTFTIPDLRGVFRRGADLLSDRGASDVGVYQADGLPNITGLINGIENGSFAGAFYATGTRTASGEGNGPWGIQGKLDASRSSSVYKNGLTEARVKNVGILPILKY